MSRPAIAAERLSQAPPGDVHFRLKTPYRDGTTQIVLEPLDFMARLAALVLPPRAHQTRVPAADGKLERPVRLTALYNDVVVLEALDER